MPVNLSAELVPRGVDVDLILMKKEGPYLKEVRPDVNIIDFGSFSSRDALVNLTRYLRSTPPDALLATIDNCNVIALIAKKFARYKGPVVVNLQNNISSVYTADKPGYMKRRVMLMKLLFGSAKSIATVSDGVGDDASEFLRLPREKFVTIYNPVLPPGFWERANQPVDHPWFAPGQPPVVVSVGRLHPQKDYPTELRAFRKVVDQVDARLIILGEGELRPELEALVRELGLENHVQLPGFVDHPMAYVKNARLFAMTSRYEGLPTVLIEALAVDTPSLYTDCPSGPMEILEGGKYGTLVPMGDVDTIAQEITRLLTSPKQSVPEEAWRKYTSGEVATRYQKELLG